MTHPSPHRPPVADPTPPEPAETKPSTLLVERPTARPSEGDRGWVAMTAILRSVERAAWRTTVVTTLWLAWSAFGVWSTGR